MKRSSKLAIGAAAALGLGATVAVFAHPGGMGPGMMGQGMMGPGMGGPMAGGMQHGDASFADDMRLVHAMLFDHDKIKTVVETTDRGSIVTQTSGDAKVVAALQAHAVEVSELAREGMAAMMRNMRAGMMARAAQR